MVNFMSDDFCAKVSQLDGFLSGIAALQGYIRQYGFNSFVIERKPGESIDSALRGYFYWNSDLEFEKIETLPHGLRDLEKLIGYYLIIFAHGFKADDLRRYLSFRVMEIISDIVPYGEALEVIFLKKTSTFSSSDVVFFVIKSKDFWLVMQFNNNEKFHLGNL